MTADEFRRLAFRIAGERWRTKLPPMIDRTRQMVRHYANGQHPIPLAVELAMKQLAGSKETRNKESEP